MKIILLFLVLTPLIHAQQQSDTPPVVTVHMTPEEVKALDAANKAVADAQTALAMANQAQLRLENDIMTHHRDKLKLPWAECDYAPVNLWAPNVSISAVKQSEAKGYISRLDGPWVIFTRGFSTCHGE